MKVNPHASYRVKKNLKQHDSSVVKPNSNGKNKFVSTSTEFSDFSLSSYVIRTPSCVVTIAAKAGPKH